jgi:hypothetical protein
MESLTNISALLADNSIVVPSYQRAYSWDTFTETLEKMEEPMLLKLLRAVTNASCTTYVVKETTEAAIL